MKYRDFEEKINRPIFRVNDSDFLRLNIYNSQLSLWKKQNYLSNIKKGIYLFNKQVNDIDKKHLAYLLYQPSYISLELALSYYGLIPEVVQTVTSITPKTTRRFQNIKGKFIYRNIKKELYWGYDIVSLGNNGKFLLAQPEKALLDYLYLNKSKINNVDDVRELRLNSVYFKKIININKLKKYLKEFSSVRLCNIVKLILQTYA